MKKARFSQVITPAALESVISQVSTAPPSVKEKHAAPVVELKAEITEPPQVDSFVDFVSETPAPKPTAKTAKITVPLFHFEPATKTLKAEKNTPVVPFGRPKKYVEAEERRSFNTNLRLTNIQKLKYTAFQRGITVADLLDEILNYYFSENTEGGQETD